VDADLEAWKQHLAARREHDRASEDSSDDYWTPAPEPPPRWWTHPDAEPQRSVERPVPFNGQTWEPAEGFEEQP